ncbi:citrate (Si)-synthase [Candidatus Parcubacteria bacterium]|nr:MAG: citrate (Si)-synthase [Candidatus Parcubacteria bacterium]
MDNLKKQLGKNIEKIRQKAAKIRSKKGDEILSTIKKKDMFSGLRGITTSIGETSYVDPESGLMIRGKSISDLSGCLPEEVFFLLLTGRLPKKFELHKLSQELAKKADLPGYVYKILKILPPETHPMTMFNTALLSLQNESVLSGKYNPAIKKEQLWQYVLTDCLNLIAKAPIIASAVYQLKYKAGKLPRYSRKLSWSKNFSRNLGIKDKRFDDLIRLYLVLHSDHEGANVSVNSARLVASALSDPYFSVSAGLNGLAGPLHGLACQESVRFILKIKKHFGKIPTKQDLEKYLRRCLLEEKIIPGYGHAVLRATDQRFLALLEFSRKYRMKNEALELVCLLYQVTPGLLKEKGKIKNPYPNVDAISGSLLYSFGLKETEFYTVVFALARILGICSQIIWDRALNLPLVRPRSITLDQML